MDNLEGIMIVSSSAFLIVLIIGGWLACRRKRRPRFNSSLVIAESLQPQVVCKSVPCQHPYYRVISEYSVQKTSAETCPKEDVNDTVKENSKKIDETEWYRKLSLSSLRRQDSHTSRRSSISDIDGTPVRVSKIKPPIVV